MQMNEQNIGLHSDDMDVQIGLVSAHVSGRLSGLVAQIKVRQVYKNWSETNIECVYTFPLAWQSVLLGMRVELNGNRLAGMVKPKKTAEVEYEQAIDNGDLPVMLERAGKDLYTANIGNIQPGDEAVIELDYAQILKAEDGAIRFSLPTTIAPRYGEADDAGVRLHQQAAADPQAEHRLFLSLDLSESLSAGTVHSPTHVIHTNRQGEGRTVRLASMAWLDRDFVLVIDRIGDMNFAVAAKDPVHPGEATLLTGSMFPPQKQQRQRPAAIKVLVDCSGSMQGDSISQARDCLDWLLGQLSSTDMLSLTRFGSTVEHDHPALQPCSSIYKQVLKSSIRKTQADLGGTEIDQALQEVIALDSFDGKKSENPVILLITDGEVWDIENTVATVRASGHRIYAVGVGSSPAESLLKDMAEVTGGTCEMVTPRENMQRAVERLLMRLRQTQAVDQTVRCSAPVLRQSPATRVATPGEGLTAWHQIKAADGCGLQVELHNPKQVTATVFPVTWDDGIELARIAAAIRLRDMADAKERETLALEYQLVTSETNLILVHQRAEGEKAEDLPELHQVRPMLASGWGGNGSVSHPHAAQRCGGNAANVHVAYFLQENRSIEAQPAIPAVWRASRSRADRLDAMSSSGMDDIEIPAFLRKAADGSTQPVKKTPPPPQRQSGKPTQTPQASADELIATLYSWPTQGHPIQTLLNDFNQAALNNNQFRSALAACLRTSQASYLQWLVMKHMKTAGSASPVWAVFIDWAAKHFSIPLDRHAERLLREFLKSVKPEVQDPVRTDLEAMLRMKHA